MNILPYTIVGNGKTLVATSGTPVPLASATATASITVRSLASNTGKIYVGNSSMSISTGFQLSADETVSLDLNNLSKIYIDADNSGEGVTYIWIA